MSGTLPPPLGVNTGLPPIVTPDNHTGDLALTSAALTERSVWEIWVNALILLLFVFISLAGNVLVVIAVSTNDRLQQQLSNLFIINLSVTDMTLAVVVMGTSLVGVAADLREIPAVWCNICCAANYVCIIVSMFTLAAISVDRYIAIVHSLRYLVLVKRRSMVIVTVFAWIQGVAFAAAPSFMNWVHYDYWEGVCAIDWHKEKTQAVYYVIVAFVVCFALPGAVMIFCYVRIIAHARRLTEVTVAPSANNDAQKMAAKRAAKTITSLLIIVLFFFVCMTPFCVTKLLKVLNEDVNAVPHYANLTASYFQYVASGVNPFIYGIFRADFRQAYANLFRKFRSQNLSQSTTSYAD